MTIEQLNKEKTQAFFAALNRGDVPAIVQAYAEDGHCITMGNTLISGKFDKAQIAAAAGSVFQVFPKGIQFTIHAMTAEADRVAVEATSEGLHVSGQTYSNQYHFFMRFRDGQIVEFKEYMDTERVTDILCGGQKRPASAA